MTAPARAPGTRGEVLRASAGTGKTWQLTTRFLARLLEGVDPEHVLGTTFTRKAAAEIRDRLLGRLAAAAVDPGELGALREAVGRPGLDAGEVERLLADLARRIDRLAVSTLDAWFLQAVRGSALALGLPPRWDLVDEVDDGALRSDAVAVVLERAERQELLALLRELQHGGETRSVHQALLAAVTDAYGVYLDAPDEAWEAFDLPQPAGEADLARLRGQLEGFVLPTVGKGAKARPDQNWLTARDELLEVLAAEDFAAAVAKGLGKAVLEGKTSYSRKPLPAGLGETILGVLRHLAALEVRRHADRRRAWHDLLRRFDGAYRELKVQRGAFVFDDMARLLRDSPALLTSSLPKGLRHVLLDEFQDTSFLQWSVLEPLLRDLLAAPGEASVFCVGDDKQSVYGWRGGEPRLLGGLQGRLGMSADTLTVSRRSAPCVLEAVNHVFGALRSAPALTEEPTGAGAARLAAARAWSERFAPHAAHHATMPGYVSLREVGSGGNAEASRRAMWQVVAEHVHALHEAEPQASIGVLLRVKKPIPDLIHALRRRGVRASDEGGNPLTDAAPVLAALSLFRLADHPGDRAAFFHVATSPLGEALEPALDAAGVPGVPGTLGARPEDDGARARALSRALRRVLLEEGYGTLLGRLLPAVATSTAWDEGDRRRFQQLVDLAHLWDRRATLRPGDFVRHVRQTKVDDPTTSRVKVMTVHASKGLEFDAVVLPDLHRALEPSALGQPLMWRRPAPFEPVDAVFPRVGRVLASLVPALGGLLDATRQREIEEELCVLYVAMTRAVRRLDLFVGPATGHRTFARLLRETLGQAGRAGEDGVLYEDGDPEGWARSPADHQEPDVSPASAGAPVRGCDVPEDVQAPGSNGPARAGTESAPGAPAPPVAAGGEARREGHVFRPPARRALSPSSLEGGRRVRAQELLASRQGSAARARGLVVHRWLQEVAWLEEFRPEREGMLALARDEALRREQRVEEAVLARWWEAFQQRLQQPNTRATLSRPALVDEACAAVSARAPDTDLELWRERRFAVRLEREPGQDDLVQGVFDRVVLRRRGDRVASAEIIDFKTDRPGGDGHGLEELVERYRPQLEAYRQVLCALTGLRPAAVRCRLLFLETDAVREV